MSDLASLALLALLALLVIGALRLDLLGQLWREWLRLGDKPPGVADWHDHAHGAYGLKRARTLRDAGAAAHKPPPYHRSGRRG